MITFEKACKYAFELNREYKNHHMSARLVKGLDCGDFFTICSAIFDENGEPLFSTGKISYDIRKSDGKILSLPSYLPGTEYGNILDHATELEIPEEYRE